MEDKLRLEACVAHKHHQVLVIGITEDQTVLFDLRAGNTDRCIPRYKLSDEDGDRFYVAKTSIDTTGSPCVVVF